MKRVLLLVSLIFSLRSMDRDEEIKSVLIGRVLMKEWVANPQSSQGVIGRLCLLDLESSSSRYRGSECYRIVKIVGKETDGRYSLKWNDDDSSPFSEAGPNLYELTQDVLKMLQKMNYFQ